MIQDNHSILIIEMGGIGDLVMAIPAVRAIRQNYPNSYIALLVVKRAEMLLKGCPYINEVFTFEIENFTFSKYAFNLERTFHLLKTIIVLRGKKFNLAVNLHRIASFWGSLRMRIFLKVLRPEVCVGRDTDKRGSFYDIKLEESLDNSEHEVETKTRIVKLFNIAINNKDLELWLSDDDKEYADGVFSKYGIANDDLIVGINPNSAQASKLWFDNRFAELADTLSMKYNAKLIFFGSVKNKKRIKRILSLTKSNAINLAGKVTLSQYAALIKKLKVFITLDSGPMHIASVFKTPTVVIFGSGNYYKFSPYHNENSIIIKKERMRAISVSDVISSFEELVKKI